MLRFCRRFITSEDVARLSALRNIGISAHIDSGKTTLTERILFYTGRIKEIHEVKGKDNVGAKMDSMELERERGITIQSAATYARWRDCNINIVDTPGHIDFTIEVERALRVLDGAILVLCAVSGVQSQTITVDRQMKRYSVPRLAFVNKMDRSGANPWRVVDQIRKKLNLPAAALNIPIGAETDLEGTVDILSEKAYYYKGKNGEQIEKHNVPTNLKSTLKQKKQQLIECLADADEEIAELYLNDLTPSTEQLQKAIRRATIALKFVPVYFGSAYKNKGVQALLDGVCDYLPNPSETNPYALCNEEKVPLKPAAKLPLVALAFKLEEGKYGQLTYLRVYQGQISRSMTIINTRTKKKLRVSRLVRTHSNELEEVDSVGAGEICALFGVECASGDTFAIEETQKYSMTSMHVPDPVVSLSLKAESKDAAGNANIMRALTRFQKEDPTFKVKFDGEIKEMIIQGMGELHLEIYVERMKREYNAKCITGKPKVAFNEAPRIKSMFNYTHKRQSGGAGQFARVIGYIEPIDEIGCKDVEFVNEVIGGAIPANLILACEKGFFEILAKGIITGNPVVGVRMVLTDGLTHLVDSNELSFKLAIFGAFKQAMATANPVVLEPIMTVNVVAPVEDQGNIMTNLTKRKGIISDSETQDTFVSITAAVPLNNMFGYSGDLRAMTKGQGEFTVEYLRHEPVLPSLQLEMETLHSVEKKK